MNDRYQGDEAMAEASLQSYKEWEREENEPKVRRELMDRLELDGPPQRYIHGQPYPKPARPIDDFVHWLEDHAWFVAELVFPGELSRDEVVYKYKQMWINDLFFADGWEAVRDRYELEI